MARSSARAARDEGEAARATWAEMVEAAGARAGQRSFEDEDVECVAVTAKGARNEPVVAGVMHGGVQVAIEPEDVQLLVPLVFVDLAERNLDNRVDDVRRARSDRKRKIISHGAASLPEGRTVWPVEGRNQAVAGMVRR